MAAVTTILGMTLLFGNAFFVAKAGTIRVSQPRFVAPLRNSADTVSWQRASSPADARSMSKARLIFACDREVPDL
jgi:hypothetical protein